MKINNNTLILLLLLYSCSAIAMEQEIKTTVIKQPSIALTPEEIKSKCPLIQTFNEKNERQYKEYILNNGISCRDEKINLIKTRLSCIQKETDLECAHIVRKINLKYTPFFTAIQKERNISEDLWTYILHIFRQTTYV